VTDEADGRPLEATGERLMPELQHGEVVHAEHLVRYLVAAELARDCRVLDAACGEGYGTELLAAAGARSATGVDIDEGTVAHARSRHPGPHFLVGDVRELPCEDDAFDLVVCFETIEHVPNPESALSELQRVTAPDGLLIVSTPNKHQYRVENEYHEREFFHEEFVELLRARFASVEILLQHNWLTSAVLPVPAAEDQVGEQAHELALHKLVGVEPGAELYTLAVCGGGELPRLRGAAVAASVDEAHELARRLVEAERTAEMWHAEFKRAEDVYKQAERSLFEVYGSVWWRLTAPPRQLAERVRRRRSG
jgi:ubiquinone/menaquinone biosynthesis C-methylase UbiE